jgi:hydroxymethylbilane synthase
MNGKKVILGTRGSKLALIQTDITAAALKAIDPSLEVEIKIIETQGDSNFSPIPLDTVGKGWFTKEIEQALSDGSIDLAVHSLKDLEVEGPPGLVINTFLSREDPRDALVSKNNEPFEKLPAGAIVGTDSIRRRIQLLALRQDLKVESVRGNVPTRLSKLDAGNYDALVLAAAGLIRLGLKNRIAQYFEPNEITPAPGQGILAVQSRGDDTAMQTLLLRINDERAARAAHIERSFSRMVGGGCKAPVGAHMWEEGETIYCIGMLAGDDGSIVRDIASAPLKESDTLGEELAKKLLSLRDHANI